MFRFSKSVRWTEWTGLIDPQLFNDLSNAMALSFQRSRIFRIFFRRGCNPFGHGKKSSVQPQLFVRQGPGLFFEQSLENHETFIIFNAVTKHFPSDAVNGSCKNGFFRSGISRGFRRIQKAAIPIAPGFLVTHFAAVTGQPGHWVLIGILQMIRIGRG